VATAWKATFAVPRTLTLTRTVARCAERRRTFVFIEVTCADELALS
jgi:hypothetical protein